MDRRTAFEHHLRSLDPERVADALSELPRELLEPAPRDTLVEVLSMARPETLESLTAAQTDLLTAAAEAAEDDTAPRAATGTRDGAAILLGMGMGMLMDTGRLRNARVDREELLARIGASEGAARQSAQEALSRLLELLLLWPDGRGGYHLAGGLAETFAREETAPRLDPALTRAYGLPELRRIARALGLDPAGKRAAVQARVVARLTDREQVRALLEQAPPGAAGAARDLARQHAVLATHAFEGGGLYGEERYRFRDQGSGDPDTDWLAERGLLVPLAPERAVLPREVAAALRSGAPQPFAAHPPAFTGVPVDEEAVAGQAQSALVAALGAADRLMAEIAGRPAALRKAGGLTVRDRKRLAGALEASPERTALWIELALAAGLLELRDQRLEATDQGRAWSGLEPAQRLVPLVQAWMPLPDVPTWIPQGREPATPGESFVYGAAPLRQGLVLALAGLPAGRGSGVGPASLAAQDEALSPLLAELLQAVLWHRPAARQIEELTPVLSNTLGEAELLGAVVNGAPTPLGRALARGGGAIHAALAHLLPPVERTARFQGDMTVTVTGSPGAELERLLSAVADRESSGYASTWRLSAASVRRALDAGYGAGELVERLTEAAVDASLPQTVEYLVRDTARGHGRMRVLPAGCVVRCADTALAGELAGHRRLRGLGLRAVADTVLVGTEPPETTLALLRAQGYAPVLEDHSGAAVVERAPGAGDGAPVPGRRERLLELARTLAGQG